MIIAFDFYSRLQLLDSVLLPGGFQLLSLKTSIRSLQADGNYESDS